MPPFSRNFLTPGSREPNTLRSRDPGSFPGVLTSLDKADSLTKNWDHFLKLFVGPVYKAVQIINGSKYEHKTINIHNLMNLSK